LERGIAADPTTGSAITGNRLEEILDHQGRALSEWRSGWRYVFCADAGSIAMALQTYTTGIFMKPLIEEMGWSRAAVSGNMVIMAVCMVICAPLSGQLVDRYGSRRIALIGAPLFGLSVAGIGLCTPSIWTWWLAWTFYGVFTFLIGPQVWAAAISRHFKVSRGLALAVGLSGNGLGAVLWPGLTIYLIGQSGWRVAYISMGALIAVVLGAICYALMRGAAAEPACSNDDTAEKGAERGLSSSEAFRSWTFWQIAGAASLMGAAVTAVIVHLPSLLSDNGWQALQIAELLAILGPAVIGGRLLVGYLLDKLPGRVVTLAVIVMPAVGCMALINFHGGYSSAFVAVVLIGMTSGAEGDIIAYLLGRYFGLRNFGMIYGVGLSVFAVGYGCAPAVAGRVFDILHSYNPMMVGLTAMLLLAAPTALTLRRYPDARDGGPEIR
jgi:MFS family permease